MRVGLIQKSIISFILISTLFACGKKTNDPMEMIQSNIIVGSLDWVEVSSLANGPAKSSAMKVGLLEIPAIGSRCTAFLIDDDIVMTNEHCIPSAAYARGVTVKFKVEKNMPESQHDSYDCSEFIGNNRTLDFALLKCKNSPGRKYGKVTFANVRVAIQSKIYIVQQNCDYYTERSCEPNKKIAYGDILGTDNEYTHNADTLGGSSGSPVFSNDSHSVVAIHHAGYGNDGSGRGIENYAVPMPAIVADIQRRFPDIDLDVEEEREPPVADIAPTSFEKAMDINAGQEIEDKISKSQSQHFYKLSTSSSGYLNIKLSFKHSVGDLDIAIYDSNKRLIAKSESTKDIEIIKKYVSRGSYYLQIYGFKGAIGNYQLITF